MSQRRRQARLLSLRFTGPPPPPRLCGLGPARLESPPRARLPAPRWGHHASAPARAPPPPPAAPRAQPREPGRPRRAEDRAPGGFGPALWHPLLLCLQLRSPRPKAGKEVPRTQPGSCNRSLVCGGGRLGPCPCSGLYLRPARGAPGGGAGSRNAAPARLRRARPGLRPAPRLRARSRRPSSPGAGRAHPAPTPPLGDGPNPFPGQPPAPRHHPLSAPRPRSRARAPRPTPPPRSGVAIRASPPCSLASRRRRHPAESRAVHTRRQGTDFSGLGALQPRRGVEAPLPHSCHGDVPGSCLRDAASIPILTTGFVVPIPTLAPSLRVFAFEPALNNVPLLSSSSLLLLRLLTWPLCQRLAATSPHCHQPYRPTPMPGPLASERGWWCRASEGAVSESSWGRGHVSGTGSRGHPEERARQNQRPA